MMKQTITPIIYNKTIFENKDSLIKKKSFWAGSSLYMDEETKLLKVNLPDSQAFNVNCHATFALENGKRATSLEFNYLDNFHEKLALVGVSGKGYGFINKNIDFVIPPKYNCAKAFHNGFALVSNWNEQTKKDEWLFVDKEGKEYYFENNYVEICNNCEDMFRVSTEKLQLAYYSDHEDNAGLWGYVDGKGKEVITPQYIYAYDFQNGVALVCKGKWEWTDEGGVTFFPGQKWEKKMKGGYVSDKEFWGIIDKTGKEIVPCKFDEIQFFYSWYDTGNTQYLKAHYGGWKNGKWGIIDLSGQWIVKPIFEALGYEVFNDDYFEFYSEDSLADVPIGIYSIKEQKVLFEPQFFDVDFNDNGTIIVEMYDKNLNRNITQIIDKAGKPIFKSKWSSIYNEKDGLYQVWIMEKGKRLHGLIDNLGNEILPCKYENINWLDDTMVKEHWCIFKQNGKCGVMTFDEKIIIDPIYDELRKVNNYFFYATLKEKEGLLDKKGAVILPAQYKSISVYNNLIIARDEDGSTLYSILQKNIPEKTKKIEM
ncbi:WG repeat-containing protein [Endomicrobium proavitum]|uniref:WG repeat-containing protein n=1 Tax=Endomicrobium proavitum TaxID=1408281 RepID=A0A0G3WLY8_9BACT|nr:WG repeat-containing protein [Endomicrobium proavitum]AKL98469.1 hypothetical protein Epro_1090 [Endomicrobium proavitum]